MYVPDALKKVNKFVDVAIPSNRSYFDRLGEVSLPPSSYTGDEVAPVNMDKIQEIEDYKRFAASVDAADADKSDD